MSPWWLLLAVPTVALSIGAVLVRALMSLIAHVDRVTLDQIFHDGAISERHQDERMREHDD